MISTRLLSKLKVGKKYLITNGIGYYILDVKDDVIWCRELGFPSSGVFGIYMKDWETVLRENIDDSKTWREIHYDYDKTQPTYRYYTRIVKLFVSAQTYFSTYDLFFLGEYNEDIDFAEIKRYCNLYGITYKWQSKKERRKTIYK